MPLTEPVGLTALGFNLLSRQPMAMIAEILSPE